MITPHECRGCLFTIQYSAQEPAFTVDFPGVPDIITRGNSLAEAYFNACEALDLHLESLQTLNLALPEPRHRLAIEKIMV